MEARGYSDVVMILAQANADFWDKLLSGQVGFILATILWGLATWYILSKMILPRWDRQTTALEKLGDGVRLMVAHVLEKDGKSPEEILRKVDEISGR